MRVYARVMAIWDAGQLDAGYPDAAGIASVAGCGIPNFEPKNTFGA